MAAVDPFWLRDRVGPGLDNDPDELIRAAEMAEKLDGRRSPARSVNDPGERGAIGSISRYQRARGLKPDGLVNPDGATAQRMTAELYERNGPRRENPVRGGSVPLWGPVGAGGDNDPRDLAATRHALFLAGLPMTGADAGTPLRRFQQQHGLAVDGRMEPFGPTHDRLDRNAAPMVASLAGDDADRPLAFRPRAPEMVGRVLAGRRTTVRTFLQDPETLPTEAQHAAAVSLARKSAEDAAIQAQWSALEGGEGDDMLTGGAGEDGLDEAPGRDGFSGVEPPPDPVAIARQRLEESGVPLTPRQLDAAAREAVSQGLDSDPDRELAAWAESFRRSHRDHHQDMKRQLASGELDRADLEKIVTVVTRDTVTAHGNRVRDRRTIAAEEVLADLYVAEARSEGIEIDAAAARERVARVIDAAKSGKFDSDGLGNALLFALEFAPVTGKIMSAREAYGLYRELGEAEADGASKEDLNEIRAAMVLALGASVPFLGKLFKAGKVLEKLSDVSGLTKLKEQQGYRKLLADAEKRMTDHDIKGFNVTEHLSEETWEKLDRETRGKIVGLVNIQKGKAGERLVKEWLDLAGFTRPLGDEGFLRRYRIIRQGQKDLVRHYDEVTDEVMESLFGGLWFRKVKGEKGTAWEVKTDRAELSRLQREFAEEMTDENNKTIAHLSEAAKKDQDKFLEIPDIGDNVRTMRVPLTEVNPDAFRSGVRKMLKNGGIDQSVIDELTVGIDAFFEAARSSPPGSPIRQNLTADVVFMTVAAAVTKQGAVRAIPSDQ